MSTDLKGFAFFLDLARWNLGNNAYELFWFGRGQFTIPGVTNIEVDQVGGYIGDMTNALIHEGIHVALVSPRGFETYSFVAHEAIAAGCYVVTHASTGNVASAVRRFDSGAVVDNPQQVVRLLRSESFREFVTVWGRERPIGHFSFDDVSQSARSEASQNAV